MMSNKFNVIWLRQQSKTDFNIRALVNCLDTEICRLHRYGGYQKIQDELFRIDADSGYLKYLADAHLKFLYLKKTSPGT